MKSTLRLTILLALLAFNACEKKAQTDTPGSAPAASVTVPALPAHGLRLQDSQGKTLAQGEFTDRRDRQKYSWVRIGTQIWTAQNLNFAVNPGSLCLQCSNWGRLYDFSAAAKACPAFFHLPTQQEWDTLITHAGAKPGLALKAGWGWDPLGNGAYGNGSDSLGFGALAGGGHFGKSDLPMEKRIFKDAGKRAYFWTAEGKRITVDFRSPRIGTETSSPLHAYSVRCVLDPS